MIKFLFVVFLIIIIVPSVFGMICSYFHEKKVVKSKRNKPSLTHAQMMALLEPDEKPVHKPVQKIEKYSEKKRYEQSRQTITNQAPHEVQSIILKREIYY